jgi:hypothetical protein
MRMGASRSAGCLVLTQPDIRGASRRHLRHPYGNGADLRVGPFRRFSLWQLAAKAEVERRQRQAETLEDENGRLKKLSAESMLDVVAVQDILKN